MSGVAHDPWLLLALGGAALLGGIAEFMTIIILPRTATQDAYSRLDAQRAVNAVAQLLTVADL